MGGGGREEGGGREGGGERRACGEWARRRRSKKEKGKKTRASQKKKKKKKLGKRRTLSLSRSLSLYYSHLARDQHVVPRDHLDVHAHLHGLLDRLLRVEPRRVEEGQHADELPHVFRGQLRGGVGAGDGHAADAAEAVLGDLKESLCVFLFELRKSRVREREKKEKTKKLREKKTRKKKSKKNLTLASTSS